ncbi:MAG: WD40/YVTN/BNR-like repeat-containing protein, partial [Mycobacteriales bacterium]
VHPAGGLPAGLPPLYGISCPGATTCYAVGGPTASGTGAVVSTQDGRTWTVTPVGGTSVLYAVACSGLHDCEAVGAASGTQGVAAATTNGASWTAQSVPAGTLPLDSVACPAAKSCLAVGATAVSAPARRSSVASFDGAAWTGHTGPSTKYGPTLLYSVSCPDAAHCWAVGGGAFFSPDLGTSWSNQTPPINGPAVGCTPTGGCASWSLLYGVYFTSATSGVIVGGDQCGGPMTTFCPGAAFTTSDGGAQWVYWADAHSSFNTSTIPFFQQVFCRSGGCLATAQRFHDSAILTSPDGRHWQQVSNAAGFLYGLACGPGGPCFAVGTASNVGEILDVGP